MGICYGHLSNDSDTSQILAGAKVHARSSSIFTVITVSIILLLFLQIADTPQRDRSGRGNLIWRRSFCPSRSRPVPGRSAVARLACRKRGKRGMQTAEVGVD
jgi:hypothetical protein